MFILYNMYALGSFSYSLSLSLSQVHFFAIFFIFVFVGSEFVLSLVYAMNIAFLRQIRNIKFDGLDQKRSWANVYFMLLLEGLCSKAKRERESNGNKIWRDLSPSGQSTFLVSSVKASNCDCIWTLRRRRRRRRTGCLNQLDSSR